MTFFQKEKSLKKVTKDNENYLDFSKFAKIEVNIQIPLDFFKSRAKPWFTPDPHQPFCICAADAWKKKSYETI